MLGHAMWGVSALFQRPGQRHAADAGIYHASHQKLTVGTDYRRSSTSGYVPRAVQLKHVPSITNELHTLPTKYRPNRDGRGAERPGLLRAGPRAQGMRCAGMGFIAPEGCGTELTLSIEEGTEGGNLAAKEREPPPGTATCEHSRNRTVSNQTERDRQRATETREGGQHAVPVDGCLLLRTVLWSMPRCRCGRAARHLRITSGPPSSSQRGTFSAIHREHAADHWSRYEAVCSHSGRVPTVSQLHQLRVYGVQGRPV